MKLQLWRYRSAKHFPFGSLAAIHGLKASCELPSQALPDLAGGFFAPSPEHNVEECRKPVNLWDLGTTWERPFLFQCTNRNFAVENKEPGLAVGESQIQSWMGYS